MRHQDSIYFADRSEAGRLLAERLADKQPAPGTVILGLARGGLPVAAEIARLLECPLDVMIVRKLGAPYNPELAVGAVASGGIAVYNEDLLERLALEGEALESVRRREAAELARRESAYRRGREPVPLRDRPVILVDDGMATGASMQAAVEAARRMEADAVTVAVPTSSRDAAARLAASADRVLCLSTPDPYYAVGQWYRDFRQLTDRDVTAILDAAATRDRKPPPE